MTKSSQRCDGLSGSIRESDIAKARHYRPAPIVQDRQVLGQRKLPDREHASVGRVRLADSVQCGCERRDGPRDLLLTRLVKALDEHLNDSGVNSVRRFPVRTLVVVEKIFELSPGVARVRIGRPFVLRR